MNNISNIDLECNFNNLRNMIYFNCGKMYDMSSKFWADKGDDALDDILKDDKNWWVRMITDKLDSIMEVSISKEELAFDIATPHIPLKNPSSLIM